jgi:hypothetical protein
MDIETARTVLGWCTVINFSVLLVWTGFYIFAHNMIEKWHSRIFPMPIENFATVHYKGIMYYKIGIILFNLVPYLALVIVSCHYVG